MLARLGGDPGRAVSSLAHAAALAATSGRFARALALLGEIEGIVAQYGDTLMRAHLHIGYHFFFARRSQFEQAKDHFSRAQQCFEQCPGHSWVQAPALHTHAISLRQAGAYEQLRRQLPAWQSLLTDFGQSQHAGLVFGEETLALAQAGDLSLARRSLERGRARWQVEFYTFNDYLLGIAEVWLLLGEARYADAVRCARETLDNMRSNGHAWFKLPRVRVRETCVWAQLLHAIAEQRVELAPRRRELERMRHSGIPPFEITSRIAAAGLASLHGEHARAQQLWREALEQCELLSMHGYAAALRWRLVAAGCDDAERQRELALLYFEAERIADIDRFVTLMAPARRP